MINVAEELLDALFGANCDVRCAIVEYDGKKYLLKEGFDDEEFERFMDLLDFEYDESLPDGKKLEGAVLFEDYSWLERDTMGGRDPFNRYWVHRVVPSAIIECLKEEE